MLESTENENYIGESYVCSSFNSYGVVSNALIGKYTLHKKKKKIEKKIRLKKIWLKKQIRVSSEFLEDNYKGFITILQLN